VKVDVDAEPALAQAYGVRGIPALFLFKDGKVLASQAGLPDAGFFRRWLDEHAPARLNRWPFRSPRRSLAF
jgi:thioredoxin 2